MLLERDSQIQEMHHQNAALAGVTNWRNRSRRFHRGSLSIPQETWDGAKKLADHVRHLSSIKSNELYHRTDSEGKVMDVLDVLETENPSPRDGYGRIATPFDALERVHKELGIDLSTITIRNYAAGAGLVLLPATILQWFRQGFEAGMGAIGVYSVDDRVEGMNAHPLNIEAVEAAGDAAKSPETTAARKRMGQGPPFPEIHIGYREQDIKLANYGLVVNMSSDVIETGSMQKIRVAYFYIGMQAALDDRGNIFEIIDNGDGTIGAPPTRLQISGGGGAGALLYQDLTTARTRMSAGGFMVSHWIGETDSLTDFLNLSQFTGANYRDIALGEIGAERGAIRTPIGILVNAPNPPADADHLGFFDGEFAIVRHERKVINVEADKLIRTLEEAHNINGSWAYSKGMTDASGMIDYSA